MINPRGIVDRDLLAVADTGHCRVDKSAIVSPTRDTAAILTKNIKYQ